MTGNNIEDKISRELPLLDAHGLCVTIQGKDEEHEIVRNFSLQIKVGEFVGLMGAPGSGKSTAALALTGLVRQQGRITAGQVLYQGEDLLSLPEEKKTSVRGKHIGLVTQDPRGALHPMLNIGTQISNVYRTHTSVNRHEAWDQAAMMLSSFGINDPERRLRAYPHELSTGMAQRVVLAMAMVAKPQLLIADEPTSGLDVTIQVQILDFLWQASRAAGSAVILVTQDLGIIANYCDRVVVIHEGTVVEEQHIADFFSNPIHPYSRSILDLHGNTPKIEESYSAVSIDNRAPDPGMLLEVRGLCKTYPLQRSRHKIQAVDQVTFNAYSGESLGLVGESGSGKTTIGRCILRLEEPSKGDIVFRGTSITACSAVELRGLRQSLQIVFQDPADSMDPRWTVEQIINEPLAHSSAISSGFDKIARIEELLREVGLPSELRYMKPRNLSAGQQQRVAIARALATKPAFIVLDEPTSALSLETTGEILLLLRRLQLELGISYLYISHDLTTVRLLCDRIVVLYLGQVVEIGLKQQLFNSPRHPYTRALLAAHLSPDLHNRRVDRLERDTLRGEVPSPVDLPAGCYLFGRCPVQQDRCRDTPQQLTTLADGREVRCWRVEAGEI